jgi:hypothetical protein
MKIFAFEELTYPGLPAHLGPEVRLTNRYCSPQLVAQHYKEHLEELVWRRDMVSTEYSSTNTISLPRTTILIAI